jgi:hypothetical protein
LTRTEHRLLPGDHAPSLRFSAVFNGPDAHGPVRFRRPAAVVLWNAGCAGCLPAVVETAQACAAQEADCYGVAVMVRDVERTAQEAAKVDTSAVLALEDRAGRVVGLSRGQVTRDWLEASGQQGVPAAFVIDAQGVVAWMGEPGACREVLSRVVAGTWDVAAARREWQAEISDTAVASIRIVREVTDALVEGDAAGALKIIGMAESQAPAVMEDAELNILKLQALVAVGGQEGEASEHYEHAAVRLAGDVRAQASMAALVVRSMREHRSMLGTVIERLANIGDDHDGSPGQVGLCLWCRLLEAEASALVGGEGKLGALNRAEQLAKDECLPSSVQAWAAAEIVRLRAVSDE